MYYLIETRYAGPNPDRHLNCHVFDICVSPAIGNSSGEEVIEGWCGTTNGWSVYAHGQFEYREHAIKAVRRIQGEEWAIHDQHGFDIHPMADHSVLTFRASKYAKMNRDESAEWMYEGLREDLEDKSTSEILTLTGEEIRALANGYQKEANAQGYELQDPTGIIEEQIQLLRDDQ
jgi:hypothetical protein